MPVKEHGYDVFISHSKSPLAGAICEVLNAMGLMVFLNPKELDLGNEEVAAAIKSASIYIFILSEDHVRNIRCLEELSIAHRNEGAQIVPIFYHVKPEDPRYLKGVYAAAFDRYKDNDEHPSDKLEEWKKGLKRVSEYMGHVVKKKEDEDRLLEKIPVEFASANTSSSIHQQIKSRRPTAISPYDVFINHRGPDDSSGLATALYDSLKTESVKAFLDSEELGWGDHFPSVLEQAINSAKVHIAIFSKSYAESPWCLAELALMLKTKAKIIPIFYDVSPEDLRSSSGAYANAFDRYKREGEHTTDKIAEWKKALREVSYLYGPIVNSVEDEGTLLRNIVSHFQQHSRELAPSTMPERDFKYDVFLNHRGPDVKYGLTKAMYDRLKDMGLKPFLDSEELRWWDHVPSVLDEVMKNAKLHIAIFSKNYAQSDRNNNFYSNP